MAVRDIHAIAMIRWEGFQQLSKRDEAEPFFYASKQRSLIDLVGDGGTLWIVTRQSQGVQTRRYQLAYKLEDCIAAEPPRGYEQFGGYAVRAGHAVRFPDNDVTTTLLGLRFVSEKPISDPSKIGQSLQRIRQLLDDDVALLEAFQDQILARPLQDFSRSVQQLYDKLSGEQPLTATEIASALLNIHPEYGKERAAEIQSKLDPHLGERHTVDEWLSQVKRRYDIHKVRRTKHEVIDGRLLLLALHALDPSLQRQLRDEPFLDEVRGELYSPEEDMLAASVDALSAFAGYASDLALGTDRLGIEGDVNTLCTVLASRNTYPPLSVGLFGDWGSGKSFFMDQMRKRIRLIAAASRTAEAKDQTSYYFSEIRQVTFNAWHYSDANLWASLVTRIFEALDSGIEDETTADELEEKKKKAEGERIFKRLSAARELERELEHQRHVRDECSKEAEGFHLRKAKEELAKLTEATRGEVLIDLVRLTQKNLGLKDDPNIAEVRKFSEDLRRTCTRLVKLWDQLRGTGKVAAIILVALALMPIVISQATQWGLANKIVSSIGSVLVSVSGLVAGLRRPFEVVRDGVEQAQRIVDKLQEREQEELDTLAQQQRHAQLEIDRLEQELEELRPSMQLQKLIRERAEGSEYGEHLGIISAIRKDFETMSRLLRRSHQEEPDRSDNGKKGPVPRIDRIILYIDDLDRCSAERVVQVLQAVHLLLAMPLFIVVVAVDPRWLRRSLYEHYSKLLVSPHVDSRDAQEAAQWISTPMNYLEKIFQIPFTLRPMEKEGYQRLMQDLLPPGRTELEVVRAHQEVFNRAKKRGEEGGLSEKGQEIIRNIELRDRTSVAQMTPVERDAYLRQEIRRLEETENEAARQVEMTKINVTPRALEIEEHERQFILQLWPLIRTPRAGKRLANVYRLLKASLDAEALQRFIEGEEYPVALLLLAVLVGFPNLASPVFQRIIDSRDEEVWSDIVKTLITRDEDSPVNRETGSLEGEKESAKDASTEIARKDDEEIRSAMTEMWRRFCDRLQQVMADVGDRLPQETRYYRYWGLQVARFSFHTGRLVEARQPEKKADATTLGKEKRKKGKKRGTRGTSIKL